MTPSSQSAASSALTSEPPAGVGRIRIDIPNTPAAARGARAWLAGAVGAVHPQVAEDVLLCLSEAVTNAHRHTSTATIRIDTVITVRAVLVHVHDNRPDPLPRPEEQPRLGLEHGRGLTLIDACADEWGVTVLGGNRPTGKAVWFTLLGRRAGAG
ncbi:ATP-binding protein [Streptomyces sp. NPDC055078]